jgi:hypothetical protein
MFLPHLIKDISHYMEFIGSLMMIIGPCDDLAYLLTPFDTPWTLMLHFGARALYHEISMSLGDDMEPLDDVAPLEDVKAWFEDMECDDDTTPLGRDHGTLSLDDVIP